jgi:hypothetical protein
MIRDDRYDAAVSQLAFQWISKKFQHRSYHPIHVLSGGWWLNLGFATRPFGDSLVSGSRGFSCDL